MNHTLALAWAAELESGHHRQTTNVLCRTDGSKCCLGVAAWMCPDVNEITIRGSKLEFNAYDVSLPSIVADYFGLSNREGLRRDGGSIIIDGEGYSTLAAANDSGVPFHKIAAYIRENWEAL